MRLEPIKPRPGHPIDLAKVASARTRIIAEVERFMTQVQADLKQYPPARPWKHPPKSGPRKGGRRTGDLGRGWGLNRQDSGNTVTITLANPVSYATYVQGPRQARAMHIRGWEKVETPARKRWREAKPRIEKVIEDVSR